MSMRPWVIVLVVVAAATSSCSEPKKAEGETGRLPVAVETAAAALADVQESVEVVGSL